MEKEDRLNSISSKQTERSQASDILQQGKWRLNDVKIKRDFKLAHTFSRVGFGALGRGRWIVVCVGMKPIPAHCTSFNPFCRHGRWSMFLSLVDPTKVPLVSRVDHIVSGTAHFIMLSEFPTPEELKGAIQGEN